MNSFKNKLILQIHLKIMKLLMYQNNNENIKLYKLNLFYSINKQLLNVFQYNTLLDRIL